MKKISIDKFHVFFNIICQFFFIIVYLPFAIIFTKWGLLIGGGFGLIASTLNVLLIGKGTSNLMDSKLDNNGKGKGFFVLFYFLRFIVTAGLLVLAVLMQFFLKVAVFDFSFIPILISVTAMIGIIPLSDIFYSKIYKVKNVTELYGPDGKSLTQTSSTEKIEEENK